MKGGEAEKRRIFGGMGRWKKRQEEERRRRNGKRRERWKEEGGKEEEKVEFLQLCRIRTQSSYQHDDILCPYRRWQTVRHVDTCRSLRSAPSPPSHVRQSTGRHLAATCSPTIRPPRRVYDAGSKSILNVGKPKKTAVLLLILSRGLRRNDDPAVSGSWPRTFWWNTYNILVVADYVTNSSSSLFISRSDVYKTKLLDMFGSVAAVFH